MGKVISIGGGYKMEVPNQGDGIRSCLNYVDQLADDIRHVMVIGLTHRREFVMATDESMTLETAFMVQAMAQRHLTDQVFGLDMENE